MDDAPNRARTRKDSQARPISLDLRKIILAASQVFAFLHSQGHKRRFERPPRMSALAPRATELLRRARISTDRIDYLFDPCVFFQL
jgi:hypothetical protein